jgi:hypothetical protein
VIVGPQTHERRVAWCSADLKGDCKEFKLEDLRKGSRSSIAGITNGREGVCVHVHVYEMGREDERRGAARGAARSSLVDLCEPEKRREEKRREKETDKSHAKEKTGQTGTRCLPFSRPGELCFYR